MVFSKPLIIVGSLVGASSIGIGGYFGLRSLIADKTVGDRLRRGGEVFLNLTDSNDDAADWKNKITAYSAANVDTKLKIDGLTITSSSTDDQAANIKNFKAKCSDLLKTGLDVENLDSIIAKAKKWCAKDKQTGS